MHPLTHAKRFVLVSVVCFQQQLGSMLRLRHHSSCKDTYTEMACFNCAQQYASAIILGMRMACVYVIGLISSCGLTVYFCAFFIKSWLQFCQNHAYLCVAIQQQCCWSVACILCFGLTLGLSALQILFHIAFWIYYRSQRSGLHGLGNCTCFLTSIISFSTPAWLVYEIFVV